MVNLILAQPAVLRVEDVEHLLRREWTIEEIEFIDLAAEVETSG